MAEHLDLVAHKDFVLVAFVDIRHHDMPDMHFAVHLVVDTSVAQAGLAEQPERAQLLVAREPEGWGLVVRVPQQELVVRVPK